MEIPKSKPTVANVAMTLADTEYSYTLPAHTREAWIKLRTVGYVMQLAIVSGESGTTYVTVQSGKIHKIMNVKQSNVVVYFRSPQGSMVAEILSFR